MTASHAAGVAALGAAATYLVGFGMLALVLLPAGYGMDPTAAPQAVAFLARTTQPRLPCDSPCVIVP